VIVMPGEPESRDKPRISPRGRILIAFPLPLLQKAGGGVRCLAICRALKKAGYNLTLVSCDTNPDEVSELGLFDKLHLFRPNFMTARRMRHRSRSFLQRNIDIEFNDFVVSKARELAPEVVLTVFAWTAGIHRALPAGVLGILDTIDIQWQRSEQAAAHGIRDFDRITGKREELRELAKPDLLLAITPEEQQTLLRELTGATVIHTGHATTIRPAAAPDNSGDLLFLASNYDPNIRGITRFAGEVWPRILSQCPDAVLNICGGVCASLGHLNGSPGIRLRGLVDDVEQLYAESAIVLNVSLYGTGFPVKSAEAISHGKALVCNRSSARGFDIASFPGIVAEYSEMADAITGILTDRGALRSLERRALEFATSRMSSDTVYSDLVSAIAAHQNRYAPDVRYHNGARAKLANYSLPGLAMHYGLGVLPSLIRKQRLTFDRRRRRLDAAYIEDRVKSLWTRLRAQQDITNVAIFGAGKHTEWLAWILRDADGPTVAAVLDDNPVGKREAFRLSPQAAVGFDPATVDAIVLSSDTFQCRMSKRCRALYGRRTVPIIDLYSGLPPGPYPKH